MYAYILPMQQSRFLIYLSLRRVSPQSLSVVEDDAVGSARNLRNRFRSAVRAGEDEACVTARRDPVIRKAEELRSVFGADI